MSFWNELRRRSVFRVAAAYLVASWLIVQVLNVLTDPLKLPDILDTVVVVLLAIGFPVALVIAWIYEVTPQGIKVTSDSEASSPAPSSSVQRLTYVIVGALAMSVALMALDAYVLSPSSSSFGEGSRLAVLPCDDLSPDPTNSFFSTGIHEELLNRLASVSGLQVTSRTSVQQYTGRRPPIPQIASELEVDAIMECSARYSGDRVLLTAQLIDAATDTHLWSQAYPANMSDLRSLFEIQADIALRVAESLQAELSLQEEAEIERIPTQSREAYALYLRALSVQGLESNRDAIALLERAVAVDPDFALAHAFIAFWQSDLYINTVQSAATAISEQAELGEQIRARAQRALALDENASPAHAAIAQSHMWNWRWQEARSSFEQALALEPNVAHRMEVVLERMSLVASFMGDHDLAIDLGLRAREIAPNAPPSWNLAGAYAYAGEHESAVSILRERVNSRPADVLSHAWLALALSVVGDHEEALSQLRLTEQILGDSMPVILLPELAYTYSLLGHDDDARRLYDLLVARTSREPVGIGAWAMANLAIGELQAALQYLEMGAALARQEQADPGFFNLMVIKFNVGRDPVLEQPEFVALREQLSGQ